MRKVRFEWDIAKSIANQRKHGVTFTEARTVFLDDLALVTHDPAHSHDEDRFTIVGFSTNRRMLVVVHCDYDAENVVRIISARPAGRMERKRYDERWDQ